MLLEEPDSVEVAEAIEGVVFVAAEPPVSVACQFIWNMGAYSVAVKTVPPMPCDGLTSMVTSDGMSSGWKFVSGPLPSVVSQ